MASLLRQVEEVEASISGQIPEWIEGALVANGGADYTGKGVER